MTADPMPPEICCVNTQALIEYVLSRAGDGARDRLLAGIVDDERFVIVDKLEPGQVGPVTLEHLLDPDYWVSNELSLQLFDNAVAVLGGSRPLFQAGTRVVHQQAALKRMTAPARLIPIHRSLRRAQRENRKFNRTKVVELVSSTPGRALLELRYFDGVRVTRNICEWNLGIYTGYGQLSGDEVKVVETACVTEGAPACTFEMTFRPRGLFQRLRAFFVYLLGREIIEAFDQERLDKEELVLNLEARVATRTEALRRSEQTSRQLATDYEERNRELESAYRELAATQEQLLRAEKLATLGTLAGGVAHEVNNPLCFVLGNLELLERRLPVLIAAARATPETLDAELAPEVERLRAELRQPAAAADLLASVDEAISGAERVASIVRDLRLFAQGESGEVASTDLVAVVEEAVRTVRNEIEQRARLRLELEAVPPVLGNAARLSQVVVNLLVNAAQAITSGDIDDNEVSVHTRADEGAVVVEVVDSGEGFAAELRPRIFDPFFTTKGAGVGTGLGLSVSQTIVAAYGGRIDVESEPGGGSRFCVRLPAAVEPGEAAAAAEPRPSPSEGRARILVVDDEPLVAKLVAKLLEADYETAIATSGAEAKVLIRDGDFDGILSDLLMPNVSGPQLYDWVSQTQPALARRMLFMTGAAFTPQAQSFLERVPNRCLEKPLFRNTLLTAVARLLSEASGVAGRGERDEAGDGDGG